MRITIGYLVASMTLFGAFANASETFETEKVKTGILPSGGFYSLYEVGCDDKYTATIASTNGNRRWCISHNEQMSCFSRKRDASASACMSGAVAVAGDNLKSVDKYY